MHYSKRIFWAGALVIFWYDVAIMSKNKTISIAPMMAYTDRHFRYLLRLITKNTLLYTEMVTAQAVVYGDQTRLLSFHESEHPVALQLGGSDPHLLAKATQLGEKWGYDEINLNVGCPSPRVQKGCFGAALMKEPKLVADCFSAMQAATELPVTIKTRLGVDDCDSEAFLHDFIGIQAAAGCQTFILHARKAWLKGLSPKENRNVPPLDYERVYRLKAIFPSLNIMINGGITDLESTKAHCEKLDGVMIGRQACATPFMFSAVDALFYDQLPSHVTRQSVLSRYMPYILSEYAKGVPMRHLTRHLIALFQGESGARVWRRRLSEASNDDRQLIRAIESII